MKLIATYQGSRAFYLVKVYFDREWNEYVVKPSLNEATWYYTDDKEDAIETAKTMSWA